MRSRIPDLVGRILVVASAGVALRFVTSLHPVWWLVWVGPLPLLVLAITSDARHTRWMVPLAALLGCSGNFHYFQLVMPLPAAIASIAEQSLLWTFLILATRRLVVRYKAWWTVFAYPFFWVAADTLMAALLPDGNWGSLAYSQSDVLPIVQITSLLGVPGLLFLVTLVPSTISLAITLRGTLRHGARAYAITAVLTISALVYGHWRLQKPVLGKDTKFGLVSIDDPIGLKSPADYVKNIVNAYDGRVAALSAQGAQVVVLPEKIEMVTPVSATEVEQHFSALSRKNNVWLEVGIGIDDGNAPTNWEWLFAPDGSLAARYEKQHMAPPERRDNYISGASYTIHSIDGAPYALAICKDMHFAAMGRAYGQRHAAVALVPAWDFAYLDGWLEARTTSMRGIENGYSVVRASREGLLTVSDPYGRIVAEVPSGSMPGSSLLASTIVGKQVPTLYTRIGDALGWVCGAAACILLIIGRRNQPQDIDNRG